MKAAIFDLDGTLLDSLGVWSDIDREFFLKRGMEQPADYQQKIRGMSAIQTAIYTCDTYLPDEKPQELLNEWMQMCAEKYANEIALKDGAYEYLHKLHNSGIKLGVATTLPEMMFTPALKRLNVYDLFSAFVTTDEADAPKSEGTVYTLTAEKLNVEAKDCVVFEDIPEGISGIKKARMKSCLVYDAHYTGEFDEKSIDCDRLIYSYRELL